MTTFPMIAAAPINKLLHRIAIGDDALAYKELFLHYHKRLVVFSSSITRSKESAEEVVSDVFLKIWVNRSTLTRIDNFHLYIYIITKNHSINRLLKEKKEQSFSLDETVTEVQGIYSDPEQLMISAEMQKRVRHTIQSLPPRCKLIFKLVREDGLKYREVAELLNLSSKTIENQMTIALKRISESIQFDLSTSRLN